MTHLRMVTAALATALATACAGDARTPEGDELASVVLNVDVPQELSAGETAFQQNCSACHGTRGLGTPNGPPLIHIIYEPSHHADIAFYFAVERGVRAHHWGFGDMPPISGVGQEEVAKIVAYIRFLQRQVGIT